MRLTARLLLVLLSFVLWLGPGTPASAQSINCNASATDIAFGTISLRAGETHETSGTITINCTSVLDVGVCIYIGAGDGGSGAGFSPRYMRRFDGEALNFELRPNGNGAGNGTWDAVFVTVPVMLGTGTLNVPFFADITSTGVGVPPGSYNATFSGNADIRIEFNTTSCAASGTVAAVDPFFVSAEIAASCELDGGSLDFGSLDPTHAGHFDATTSFAVRCTNGTPYTVRLDDGMGVGATGPTDRRLTGPVAQLQYGLYQDGARATPWGDSVGTSRAGSGSGSDQTMTVYGRIFSGQTLYAGAYSDQVLITVEY